MARGGATSETTAGRFAGFSGAGLEYLLGLRLDNSRGYFQAHRETYETQLRGPFTALMTELAGEFGGAPKIFRPNRDVRFSGDKRPYKENVSGYLMSGSAVAYLDLSAEGLMAATGYYMMARDQIERYRAALFTDEDALAHGEELRTILAVLETRGTPVGGEALRTAPRGVPRDHPNIQELRRKSLTISATLSPDEVGDRDRALRHARDLWRAGRELNSWLDAHVGPSLEQRRP